MNHKDHATVGECNVGGGGAHTAVIRNVGGGGAHTAVIRNVGGGGGHIQPCYVT
jgi:hypothetical protein